MGSFPANKPMINIVLQWYNEMPSFPHLWPIVWGLLFMSLRLLNTIYWINVYSCHFERLSYSKIRTILLVKCCDKRSKANQSIAIMKSFVTSWYLFNLMIADAKYSPDSLYSYRIGVSVRSELKMAQVWFFVLRYTEFLA